jgi:membrane protease YdiL (CAAX protease family)
VGIPPNPPVPPASRAWGRSLLVLGLVVGGLLTIAGFIGIALIASGDAPRASRGTYTAMAAVGGVLLLFALVGLALRAIRAKRFLPPERYRGPSIFVLLLIVLVAGNIVSGAVGLLDPEAIADLTALPAGVATILLFLTPVSFLAVALLFVVWPRALAGVRWVNGLRAIGRFGAGVGVGAVAWVFVFLVSTGLEWVLRQFGQQLGGQQLAVDLLGNVPFAVGIMGVAVVAPIAEELFFRGVTLNAWEREYGPRRGLWGSTLLFTAIHVPDGGIFIVPPILILALVLGITYQRTRSLPMVIGIHATFNAISTILVALG